MILQKIKHRIKNNYIKYKAFFKINKLKQTLLYKVYFYRLIGKEYYGIHLGGGDLRIDFFLNIDANPYCDADIIASINKINLKKRSVKYIYNSHVLEHVPRAKINKVLKEWYRVLDNNGRLYVCVPNIEILFKIYLDNLSKYNLLEKKKIVDLSCGIIYGGQINKYDFHYMGYSMATLTSILEEVGFKDIKYFNEHELPFNQPNDASSAMVDNKYVSLNVVATK